MPCHSFNDCHQPHAANNSKALCRPYPVQRACKKLGLGCVAVFTEPDALSLHVLGAPESVCLGASPKEYLNATRLIEVAKETGEGSALPACTHPDDWLQRAQALSSAEIAPL